MDLARVEDRQAPLGGPGGRGGTRGAALGDGDHRRHQGDGREQSRERGAHGQHYGNPTSPLAIPGLPGAACLTAGVLAFKFANPLFRRQ